MLAELEADNNNSDDSGDTVFGDWITFNLKVDNLMKIFPLNFY
jgi:hypothetical protein